MSRNMIRFSIKMKKYQKSANKHQKFTAFKKGDLVWIHLHKECFSQGRYGKLKPQADGPFKVVHRVGKNAYKIELPEDYGVSDTFNVADLSPYHDEADERNSETSLHAVETYDTRDFHGPHTHLNLSHKILLKGGK